MDFTDAEKSFMAGERRAPYRILEALAIEGNRTRWRRLKEITGFPDAQLRELLHFVNSRGWVSGRPLDVGQRRLMEYALTELGYQVALAYRTGMITVLRRHAAFMGIDKMPEYRQTHPWLFQYED